MMDNIVSLHNDLTNKTYKHGGYESFFVNDPKRRHIHKASVRDRLLHHAIYRVLYPFFDKTFIGDSYSCRNDKGVHKAINHFRSLTYEVSRNHTRACWILKCDIRKFFDSINHGFLFNILKQHITDKDVLWLLGEVIESFSNSGDHPSLRAFAGACLPAGRKQSRVVRRLDCFVARSSLLAMTGVVCRSAILLLNCLPIFI
ncbi:MAG: hypothetical protein HY980_03315 [Candidatus Magasanikbacteria bacterium]|nr:hypothetical protein [Candidatus Magasanikbacteria bacterium]